VTGVGVIQVDMTRDDMTRDDMTDEIDPVVVRQDETPEQVNVTEIDVTRDDITRDDMTEISKPLRTRDALAWSTPSAVQQPRTATERAELNHSRTGRPA
jgi:hypothetical protein